MGATVAVCAGAPRGEARACLERGKFECMLRSLELEAPVLLLEEGENRGPSGLRRSLGRASAVHSAPRRARAPNKDTALTSPHPVFIRWPATPTPSSSACAQAFGSRPLSVPRSPRCESMLASSLLTSQESVSSFARPPVPAKVDIFADDDSSAEAAPKESTHSKKRREREAKKDADATDGKSRRITPEVTPCCAA